MSKQLELALWITAFLGFILFMSWLLTYLLQKLFAKDIQTQKANDVALTIKSIKDHSVITIEEVN